VRAILHIAAAAAALGTPSPPSPGDIAFKAGNFDAALGAYARAVAADRNDLDARIGLGTVELYLNRLADAKRDLTAALAVDPDNAIAKRRLAAVAQREGMPGAFVVDMHGLGEVDVPFIALDPLPTIHVTVNGHPLTLFIDTGAPTIGLSPEAAKAVGATIVPAGQGVFAGGKMAGVSETTLDRVDVGGITVSSMPADVIGGLSEPAADHVDGAIGTEFLDKFLSTIDYRRKLLVLRPATDSSTFEAAAQARGANLLPMWLVGDHFIFARGHVNDGPDSLFNIDTGGGGIGVQLTKSALDASHVTPDAAHAQSFTGGGGEAHALPFSATVTMGSRSKSNVPGLYFDQGDQFGIFPFAVAGTITHVYFLGGALTLDFAAMRILVE
jgi:predicted aspartyl protease